MNWTDWLNTVTNALEIPMSPIVPPGPSGDVNFNTVYPQAITYAELRMQRDLDLIGAQVTDQATLQANTRSYTLPTSKGQFIVTEQVAPIVGGVKQAPLLPVSRSYLEYVWPGAQSASASDVPSVWCPVDQATILIAPVAGSNIPLEVVGEQRFTPLSPANTSNFLTLFFPDLYIAASLVWLAGWQRDYGLASDDPQKAMSWEQTYKTLLAAAAVEEVRKKFESVGWSPRLPSPIATPAKT